MDADQHIEVFNTAVRSGDWSAFVERFTEDACVEFLGPPVGPFVGRAAITEAYEASPPDGTIVSHARSFEDGDELVVPYRWVTSGATGTMRLTESEGRIARLVITFD